MVRRLDAKLVYITVGNGLGLTAKLFSYFWDNIDTMEIIPNQDGIYSILLPLIWFCIVISVFILVMFTLDLLPGKL